MPRQTRVTRVRPRNRRMGWPLFSSGSRGARLRRDVSSAGRLSRRAPSLRIFRLSLFEIRIPSYRNFRHQSTGLVTFSSAIPIVLGAHIGTAFTPLLTIGGSSKDGKRAALIHLYFNIIGSVILLALVYALQFTIGIPMWGDVMNKSSIANIHTMTSVIAMLFFLPCSGVLSKLAMMTVPSSAEEGAGDEYACAG